MEDTSILRMETDSISKVWPTRSKVRSPHSIQRHSCSQSIVGAVVADPSNAFLEPSTFIDPLSNGTACARDLPYLQQLGVNTIRAYSVNSSLNHDSCMQLFSDNNIYTM